MIKATKFTLYLSVYIIIIFGAAIVFTYVNDWVQSTGFFGDTPSVLHDIHGGFDVQDNGIIDKEHQWGVRHYWYFWMMFFLFAVSVLRVIIWAVNYWEEKR